MSALTPADLATHTALGITADKLARKQVARVSNAEARDLLALGEASDDLARVIALAREWRA